MRFPRLLIPVLLFVFIGGAAAQDNQSGLPDFASMKNPKATAWTTSLMPVFDSAAKEYNVPLPLLLTLGYFGSAFENRYGAPTIEGGYGVMALRDNKMGGNSLIAGASLMSSSTEALQIDPALNIKAAAAVISSYAARMKIDRAKGLEAWLEPVIKYAGLDEENSKFFAGEIFQKLQAGLDYTNAAGESFVFSAQNIGSIDFEKLMPAAIKAAAGYSGATWYPAASCNYSAYYTAKDTVIVHTIEGSAAGARSWFRNCSSQVSAHYVVSEAGGVWQCVDENYRAWHVGCINSRSLGIEHEGYAASSSHPTSLYNASGLLTRDMCNRWGIPKAHRSCAPGILGHNDANNCHCGGSHWDPGGGWDWGYYIQVVAGAPPPPSYAAHYNAQSYPASMTAGSTAVVWAEYVNDGTATWGHAATNLGTSGPQDRCSPFFQSGNWIGCTRPTAVDQSAVTTGQVGRFSFVIKAPSTPGVYVEKYRPVQEGVTWFGGEVTWTITVAAAQGNITGTVRNAANSQALSGASVAISGGPSTTTNSSGVYTFNNLDPATYTLNVSKAGFDPTSGTAAVTAGATTTKDFNLVSTDATAPSNPSGLSATGISPSQINLAWTASTDTGGAGLAGYIIYRNSAEVGRTTATTYQDNGLTQNTSYSYFVKAYDNANNVSGASNTASAGTLPGTVAIFQDGFASINGALWSAIVQSPMSGPNPLVWDGGANHPGGFPGAGSIRSVDSGVSTQGCLLGHSFSPGFGAAKFESWFYDSSASNNSRQGLQVRCLDGSGGVKAIYYLGTYSAAPGSFSTYSAGYYKACGAGCTGWYWPGAASKARVVGWHKFTIDFQPYTGAGNEVKFYIDDILVSTVERTLDTQTYGLNMVAYGYHYRVNQAGWFDDCAMYASAPTVPTMGTPAALSSSSIRWSVTDTSNNEMGFRILDAAQTIKASAAVSNGTGAGVSIDEGSLAANTPYTRYAKSYNGTLNSLSSAAATRWTLAAAPSISCDRSAGVWYATPDFSFTAVGGFGQGTVSQYAYEWDGSPTHTWTGAEPIWNSGDLILGSAGSFYLHVKGFNGEGVASGTLDLGPFKFDTAPPLNPTSAVETGGAVDDQWQAAVSDPAFTWSGASDAESGIAGYLVYFGSDESATSETFVTDAAYDPAAVSTGTYYLRVRAKDNAGNLADEWETIFTFKYDSSAPDAPVVNDDGQYTGSSSTLHGSWNATDADSGIAEYQYAVGTASGGVDIVGWTSADANADANIAIPQPGLSLGTTYYISAKAKNGAGAWSDVASSDGIQLAAESLTIAAAKALTDTTPVGLISKVVTASFANSYYIQEGDRSSGILVLDSGPGPGAIVTVGGIMGVNAVGERAILEPVTTVESPANPALVPKGLYVPGRNLGGDDFNPLTPGLTLGSGLNNIGLLIQVAGTVESPGENQFFVNDGSPGGPIKVIAAGIDIGALAENDPVIVTGISSFEFDGTSRTPIIRLSGPEGIVER